MVTICLGHRLPDASSDRYPRARRAVALLKSGSFDPGGPPIWSCSGRGLPGRPVTRPPVGSYPTFSPLPDRGSLETTTIWRCISVALSFESPRLGVTQRPALRSPDFPPTVFTYVGGHPSASARADSTSGARRGRGWPDRPRRGCSHARCRQSRPRQNRLEASWPLRIAASAQVS